jgi:predicted metal-dependent hydrolase
MSLFTPRAARLTNGAWVEISGVRVHLRVNSRARHISLRVDRLGRFAVAVAPSERLLQEAAAFARTREAWLASRIASAPAPTTLAADDTIAIFGTPYALWPDGRRPRLEPRIDGAARLRGCGDGIVDPALVARAIRNEARAVYAVRAALHCKRLGVPTPSISLSDARTRWGSCTPARQGQSASIRLSWRLALAPFTVADYVVAHECAHLRQANHGAEFWKHVGFLVGDPSPYRRWLRDHGAGLHALSARA